MFLTFYIYMRTHVMLSLDSGKISFERLRYKKKDISIKCVVYNNNAMIL